MRKIFGLLTMLALVAAFSNSDNSTNVAADLDPKPHGIIANPKS